MYYRTAPVEVHGRDAVRVFAKTFDPLLSDANTSRIVNGTIIIDQH